MLKKLTLSTTLSFLLLSSAFAGVEEYVDNGDGTVTHTLTGLTWQRCSVGQTWDGAFTACTGDAKTYTFDDAQKLTSTFAGQSDWRVPSVDELTTIVDTTKTSPAINKAIFPQTTSNAFGSSSSVVGGTNLWIVQFGSGVVENTPKSSTFNIRMVRGATWIPILEVKDFVDNRDGTVTHNKTGLTWQRCSVGQTWADGGCDSTAKALTQTEATALTSNLGGNTDWRLPTLRELQTIVDYTKSSPATSLIVFPSTPGGYFCSSTKVVNNASYSWFVNFESGISTYTGSNSSARLVRGTWSGASSGAAATTAGTVDLSPTVTGTPSPAQVGGDMTFTATLTNKGTGTASDTKLSFYIPKNLVTLVSKPADCEDRGASVVCSLGYLVPQGALTRAVTVRMNKAGGLSFGVAGSAIEKDATPKDNLARATVAVKK